MGEKDPDISITHRNDSQEIYDKRDQMIGGKESKMKSTPRIEMRIRWTAEATLRGMLKESGALFMS